MLLLATLRHIVEIALEKQRVSTIKTISTFRFLTRIIYIVASKIIRRSQQHFNFFVDVFFREFRVIDKDCNTIFTRLTKLLIED